MNPLLKKEIRLLLPAWIAAVLLALVQLVKPLDFYVVTLLFLGMTIMALTTIGRETSLNTFSNMLAQPAERVRLWKTKLSILAVAFLTVLGVWLVAFVFSGALGFDTQSAENSYNLFITACLIATATFTGGLWTTLLLRQPAAAFWLTLLIPATLSGFTAAFVSQSQPDSGVIAVLCVIFAVYSVGGFLFARWLFFRAQDTGWSGGTLALPEWKWFAARFEAAGANRNRRPIFALLNKEFQLQQAALTGAVGLLVLHIGILALRANHKFARESAGEILTAIFWLLWLVLPVLIGNTAVAEERKLGVLEGQLCLPASRRRQFAIKTLATFFLGIFLGGVMPILLESIGVILGAQNPMFTGKDQTTAYALYIFLLGAMATSAWLTLVSFFASSLARNFLQAVGFAIMTLIGWISIIPIFTSRHMAFYDSVAFHSILPLVIAVPTVVVTLLGLTYRNFKSFRDGWPLWWRNLLGLVGAALFIVVGSAAIYHRAWEIFKPAEPPHGAARLSLANPPRLWVESYGNLLVRLPDGRVWHDYLTTRPFPTSDKYRNRKWWLALLLADPRPFSAGPQKFIAGSNWVSATVRRVDQGFEEMRDGKKEWIHLEGYTDTVGIQRDGTLWLSDASDHRRWTGDKLTQFGSETNWQQLAQSYDFASVLLLKTDGTLWWWRPHGHDWSQTNWPSLHGFQPRQIGTNADWSDIFSERGFLARKTDGSVWSIEAGKAQRQINYDSIALQNSSHIGSGGMGAYIRNDGTLWGCTDFQYRNTSTFRSWQISKATNWVSSAMSWNGMMALKADGTLWQWLPDRQTSQISFDAPPTRLGIHNDWVALTPMESGAVALAADGSLWFWPYPYTWEYQQTFLALPKQPKFLGNVFGKVD